MAIVEAGSTTYATANTATITTASFTPADNTLLVVMAGMGNGVGSSSSLGTMVDSLGGTWTRLAGEASASGGVAEVWCRDIGTGAAMTVTYDPGGTGASGLDVIAKWFSGCLARTSQTGATAVNGGATSFSKSITTTTTGSQVVGSYATASNGVTLTAAAGTTILGQFIGSGGDTSSAFKATSLTGTPGATTLGYSNVAAGVNRMALVEVLPSAATAQAGPVYPISQYGSFH